MTVVEQGLSHQGALLIPELGAEVYFGKEPLRHDGLPTIYDLLGVAKRNGVSTLSALRVIAHQLYLYNHLEDPNRKSNKKHDWAALGKEIPFVVSQTSSAIMRYGIDIDLDPTNFIRNRSFYSPSEAELEINGFASNDVEKLRTQPATLVGSIGIFHFDSMDVWSTVVIPRESGYYKGKYTIPGGHYDSPLDVAGLAEFIEETGLPETELPLGLSTLGTIDQIIFKENESGQVKLQRFVNLVWMMNVFYRKQLKLFEKAGAYIDSGELTEDDLAPLALSTFRMAQYM